MPKFTAYPPLESAFTYMMKKQRANKQLSYQRLGDIVGMSKSYVSHVERGLYDTSVEIGFALCEVLEIDMELFIDHIYQIKQMRVITDIERACEEWGIDVPPQFKRDQFFTAPKEDVS